jgi:hypothetical protein
MAVPEPDDCLLVLSEWIKHHKNNVYDENIKDTENDSKCLSEYTGALEDLYTVVCRAILKEDIDTLIELKWPETIIDCIRDPNTKIIILNEIEQWFLRFPFVKSKQHLRELENENAGLN